MSRNNLIQNAYSFDSNGVLRKSRANLNAVQDLDHRSLNRGIHGEIFENQRRLPGFGFCGTHLLLSDRENFSNLTGSYGNKVFEEMVPNNLPSNIIWEIDDTEKSDEHGWHYAFDFSTFKDNYKSGKSESSYRTFVRRRRWIAIARDEEISKLKFSDFIGKARAVLRAVNKFKSYVLKIKRPMLVEVISANDIRGADWNGKSDPYVIVTAHESSDAGIGVQQHISKTMYRSNTLSPTWNESVLLPSVNSTFKLCFTLVDHDYGSRDDFLGQATVCLAQFPCPLREQTLELPLDDLRYVPVKSSGCEFNLADADECGKQGILRIRITPMSASESMVGYCWVKKSEENMSSWLLGDKEGSHTLVVLTNTTINLYNASFGNSSIMDCKPTDSISINEISSIVDQDEYFEITASNGNSWRFSRDPRVGTILEQHQQRKLWLKKISLVSGVEVTITESSRLARTHSAEDIYSMGKETLQVFKSNMKEYHGFSMKSPKVQNVEPENNENPPLAF